MTRRLAILAAILILLAGQLGVPAAVLAAAPVAVNDSGVVIQKNASATTILVLANDTVDPADTITDVSNPAHGTSATAGDGRSVTYAPDAGYTGLDSFTYTVTNDPDGDDTATVSLRVNAPPIAVNDPAIPSCMSNDFGGSFPIPEDYGQFDFAGLCSAIANDTDSDGSIASWLVDTGPSHGTLVWLPGFPGVFRYTGDPDWSTIAGDLPAGNWLSDSFTYHVIDSDGASSSSATFRFWIAPVNDAPTFTPGLSVVSAVRGTPYNQPWATSISPGPNEGTQTVHFGITNTNLHGNPNLFAVAPAIAANGRLTFTLATGQAGSATITVVAKDDGGLESYSGVVVHPRDTSDPVTIDIGAENSPPVAINDAKTVLEDADATSIDVRANDSDADADPITITNVTQGGKGAVAISGGGTTVTYTPNANANGADTFTYTVSDGHGGTDIGTVNVTITPVDDAPVAVDDAKTLVEDAAATAIDVLANDTDVDADPLVISIVTQGGQGSVAITGGGTGLTYMPDPDANGPDSFTYTVSDGHGGTDTGTVNVTITPVNDKPTAVNDTKTLLEDAAATAIDVRANDTDDDGDTLTVSAKTDGLKGTVAITGGGTGLTYTPSPDANGGDTFTYTVSDGNGGTDTGTVTVTITPVQDAPVAADDTKGLAENAGPNAILVLANDIDVDGDPLSITAVDPAAIGTVTITGGGTTLTYTSNLNVHGTDTFDYTISDGHGGTSTATVTVTVSNEEQPPDAVDDAKTLNEDAAATAIDVLANDTDADDDPLTITGVTQGTIGSVVITGLGAGLTYTPNANANGADTFTYTIDDGQGGTSTATVHVTITPVNDPPVAVADAVTVIEDQKVGGVPFATTVDVLNNDTDIEHDALTVSAKTNGAKGIVTILAGNTAVSYQPNPNAFGSDTFTYTVIDGHGGSTIGTVNVTITPVNDPPNAVNDGAPTPYKVSLGGGAKSIPVLTNDTWLPDAPETLHITTVTQGGHGVVVITGGGTGLTYRPTGTALGIDVFSYTISDGHGGTDTAQVQVQVTAADVTAPKAAIVSIQKSTIPGRSGLRIYVHWSITETGSGVKSELFQRRTGSGAWVTVSLSSTATRSVSLALGRGHTYTFRVRAADQAGNVGAFASRQIRI